jgi:ligand-binding sensor domain-containing protein
VQDAAALAGDLALATNAGVTVFGADGVARSLYALQGLPNNHCFAVAYGEGGRLFVGTLGGLSILSPELSVERNVLAAPDGLGAAWVTALAGTPEGMYAGTYGGGVTLVSASGAATALGPNLRGRLVRVNPGAMALAGDRLYVGTLEDGLWVFERGGKRWRRLDAPLGSMNVTAIAVDATSVWIGTDRGAVRVEKDVLEASLVDAVDDRS